MYRVNDYLTPSERLDAMRIGGMRKLAAMGLTPKTFTQIVKRGGDNSSSPIDLLSTALRTSVFVGAPLGALWFAMKSGLKNDTKKTKKLKATLDHYNDVSHENKTRILSSENGY